MVKCTPRVLLKNILQEISWVALQNKQLNHFKRLNSLKCSTNLSIYLSVANLGS